MKSNSTAKYFGSYLVQKGAITSDILLSTLIEQVSKLPTVLEVVYKRKLLTAEQMLNALSIQNETKCDFRAACTKSGFWTSEIEATVLAEIDQSRTPIGQLLVSNRVIETSVLIRHLDDFLSKKEEAPTSKNQTSQNSNLTNTTKIDSGMVEEVVSYLSPKRIEAIDQLLQNISATIGGGMEDKDMIAPILNEFLVEMKALRGILRFARVEYSEKVVKKFEDLSVSADSQMKTGNFSGVYALMEVAKSFVTFLTSLVAELKLNASEHQLKDGEIFKSISQIEERLSKVA